MNKVIDSFWRSVAYCFHPKVIFLSVLPLILMMVIVLGLGSLYWELALDQVRMWMDASNLMGWAWAWLERMGLMNMKAVVASLVIILAITPLVMIMVLFAVSLMMTPALVGMVAARRFPHLERKHGGSLLQSLAWTLMSVFLALLAFAVTLPFWWLPFMAWVLPPLIWGWLTYRVMVYDVLAEHASQAERIELISRFRFQLLGIGVMTGMLGAAPSLIWASGALFAAAFVILIPVAVWIYTLAFVFSSLWFAHFLIQALDELRQETLYEHTIDI